MTLAPWRRLARAEARIAGDRAPVAGVDEAGRGPLAGPVVAAAVILEPGGRWPGLDDSKVVDAETRRSLFARVSNEARAFAWAVVGQRAIDRLNIRRASLEAMRRAVERLRVAPLLVLVDGKDCVPGVRCEQCALIDGDARMLSIAAASIVAKVVRDRIMERLDGVWPSYGFARHKGYATPEHLEALRVHGPCSLHRFSYEPVCQIELPFAAASDVAPAAPNATSVLREALRGAVADEEARRAALEALATDGIEAIPPALQQSRS